MFGDTVYAYHDNATRMTVHIHYLARNRLYSLVKSFFLFVEEV